MNTVELDRLFDQVVKKIVSAEMTAGRSRVELFSFHTHERSFSRAEFVGLSVEEGRRLKFAPGQPPRRA